MRTPDCRNGMFASCNQVESPIPKLCSDAAPSLSTFCRGRRQWRRRPTGRPFGGPEDDSYSGYRRL